MATLNELRERLNNMQAAIVAQLVPLAQETALSLKAIAERNILERGFGAEYSRTKYPAWFLEGKAINQKGERFIFNKENAGKGKGKSKKERREAQATNWAELKEAEGLPVDHVTLSHSNKMFGAMGVVRTEVNGSIARAFLGSNTTEEAKKMTYNFIRYGDYLDKGLGDDGREMVRQFVNTRFNQIMNNITF